MTSSDWTNTLRQFEPDYDTLSNMLENGPSIRAVVIQVKSQWRVRIEENWNISNGELYYTADYGNLDSKCEWSAEQLKTWRFVVRLSHQEWHFLNRRQAEKFVTLFNLKWAQ